MAFLVYTILRSAASTAGHSFSCSGVRLRRCFMLAICASLNTPPRTTRSRMRGLGS